MEWLKNNHPVVITAAAFCLGFVILLYASFTQFVSYDAYWHLKMGQDLLSNGLSPSVDHYSFTFADQPVATLPYLFQVALAVFVSGFGLSEGFQLIKIFSFSLFLLVVYLFYKKIKAPWPIILITLPYIFLFLLHRFFHVRPEIFDSILVVIALILYVKARESFSHRNMIYIALLQLFWVNYHVAILGYVIFFGLFLDKAVEMLGKQPGDITWRRWASWGTVLFLIGFIKPDFYHPLFSVLNFSKEWAITSEHGLTHELMPNSSLFTLFWLISAYLVISMIVRREYGLALVAGIFAFKSWQMLSLVTVSGIVVVSLLALSLSKVDWPEFFKKVKPGIRFLITTVGCLMAVSGFILSAVEADKVHQKSNIDDFPHSITSYLREKYPEGGNIFNRMRDGGYLLYHLSPGFKVYIDGRTNVLYPLDFVTRFSQLYTFQYGQQIIDEIDRYNIEFAIFPIEMGKLPVANKMHPLSVEYVDKEFILMSSRENNFPLSSRILYFPMCWQESYQSALVAEFIKAKKILPADSVLVPLLSSLNELDDSASPAAFFNSVDTEQLSSRYHQRLLGYVALELNFDKYAFDFFQSITKKETFDLLMMAYAALNDQNYDDAEKLLLFASSESWSILRDRDLNNDEQAVVSSLFETLKKHRPLTSEGEMLLEKMKNALLQQFPTLQLPLSNLVPQASCNAMFSGLPL
jgi:hypothetical protein